MPLQRTRAPLPVELLARAWNPERDVDAFEVACTEEPTPPVALALALPPPETDVYVVTLVEEPPLALALLETLDWAITSPALTSRPSKRQGYIIFFEIFIDAPLWD